MENQQLTDLLDIIEDIKNNTSDIYDVKTEVEGLGRTMKAIKQALEENNELLREVIDAIYSINQR